MATTQRFAQLLLALLHLLLLPSPSTCLVHAPSLLRVPTSTSSVWAGRRASPGTTARGRVVAPLTAAELTEVTAEEIFEGDIVTYSLDGGETGAEAEAEGCSEALGKLLQRYAF